MAATELDLVIFVVVVLLRLLVPLLIPVFPLPAIVAALAIDGVDQTIYQTQLTPAFWHDVENGYQGYDKSLDIYYLSIAYMATMRNWTNRTALVAAAFLWFYRLAGVTLFEVVHDPAAPDSWRWLLLVFPNTFEYFFIAYEIVRLRWDPRRMTRRAVIALAAFIWIFIKLPQEWWIHVARLDFTDEAAEHAWLVPTIVALLLVLAAVGWWVLRPRLPGADWGVRIVADPLPAGMASASERSAYRAANWHLLSWSVVEKVTMVGLICINFAQILPGSSARPSEVLVAVGALVVVNAFLGLAFARRRWSVENIAVQLVVLALIDGLLVRLATVISPRFDPNHALFFVLLIALIVVLYDRYRPIRELRLRSATDQRPRGTATDHHSQA